MSRTTQKLAATVAALAVAFAVLVCATPKAAYAKNVPVRSKIAAYSWAELKSIANKISKAKTNKAGLKIAKKYHLVNSKGKLTGQTKMVRLKGLGTAKIRIVGFRHDTKASGGKAGITFEFANTVGKHVMNKNKTSKGGWQKSAMRKWLNSTYLKKFPSALRNRIVTVKKKTNNVGKTTKKSCVTTTKDKLWLLSMREVYGKIVADYQYYSDFPDTRIYNSEGSQYQYYASFEDYDVDEDTWVYGIKTGAKSSWWWLRSPFPSAAGEFHGVDSASGSWIFFRASSANNVSPGFCF